MVNGQWCHRTSITLIVFWRKMCNQKLISLLGCFSYLWCSCVAILLAVFVWCELPFTTSATSSSPFTYSHLILHQAEGSPIFRFSWNNISLYELIYHKSNRNWHCCVMEEQEIDCYTCLFKTMVLWTIEKCEGDSQGGRNCGASS